MDFIFGIAIGIAIVAIILAIGFPILYKRLKKQLIETDNPYIYFNVVFFKVETYKNVLHE